MRQYGSIMLNVPLPLQSWGNVLAQVDSEDLYDPDGEHGYNLYPHITVIYGIHQIDRPLDVMLYLDSVCKKMEVKFNKISVFDESTNYDVLKFNVRSPAIIKCHNQVKSRFPCTIEYDDYKPHLTLAFIKKGRWKKYMNITMPSPSLTIDLMRFTNQDDHETLIKLR